jgi:hypothetical protein
MDAVISVILLQSNSFLFRFKQAHNLRSFKEAQDITSPTKMKTFHLRNLLTATIIANGALSSVWAVPLEERQPADLDLTGLAPNVLEARQDNIGCVETQVAAAAPMFTAIGMPVPSVDSVNALFISGGLLAYGGTLNDAARRVTWMSLAISVMLACDP